MLYYRLSRKLNREITETRRNGKKSKKKLKISPPLDSTMIGASINF